MAVWYLDNDAEITDAVARLRKATDEQVVFVVPSGSRIASGRINFKLLAREAEARGLKLAIASRDEQVRAMATSAGVLGLASAEEARAALERGDVPPQAAETAREDGAVDPAALAAAGAARSTIRRRLAVTSIALITIAILGGYTAWQSLPTARITLQPRAAVVGPIEVAILASSSVSEPDVDGGRIPAVALPIPLAVERTFAATGTESVESRATGAVVFTSPEQPNEQTIPAGTRLATAEGIEFRTTEDAVLQPSDGSGPSRVTAPVEAVLSGPAGNVAAGAISVVPSLEGIAVTNAEPTSGGQLQQSQVITAADYDAAAVDLGNRLAVALAAYLRAPTDVPEGLTLFTRTGAPGSVTLTPTPDELVGTEGTQFTLRGAVAGSVLAVDERLVDEVIRERLQAALPTGTSFLEDSLAVEHTEGSVEAGQIRFEGRASGRVAPRVDVDQIKARLVGLPVFEARAILEQIGTATVSVWPEFMSELPGDQGRIEFDVLEPSTAE